MTNTSIGSGNISQKDAMDKLAEGNKRYANGCMAHPNQDDARRKDVDECGQNPYVAVLTCSDSRVPPELIFDAGVGELFIIRLAGNVADKQAIGSLEYAVAHLNVPVLMVLGHTKCGAVTATLDAFRSGNRPESENLDALMDEIMPAVKIGAPLPGDPLANSILANIELVLDNIRSRSSIIANAEKSGALLVQGAMYDLPSGVVSIIPSR